MADTAGADFTSSMTSVTEEDGSLSESDTSNSNFSSSLLYSTDCNTDDNLTPSLNSISISQGAHKKVRKLAHGGKVDEVDRKSWCNGDNRTNLKHAFAHPFDAKCPSLVQKNGASNMKNQKRNQSGTFYKNHKKKKEADLSPKVKPQKRTGGNPFTFDYPDFYLYTDFTTNNNADYAEIETEVEEDRETVDGISESGRSLLPDMDSPSWYTAQIFNRYWLHYNIAMDWFAEHVKIVNSQYHQSFSVPFQSDCPHRYRMKSNTKERKRKRARKRRAARAKSKQKADCDERIARAENQSDLQEEETEIEMEITEDMIEFFSQSFKHRMERDKQKVNERQEEESTRIDIEQTLAGQQGPTTTAPKERPGVRRTAEMKLLYGQGAAMIHGMETALQMTFDKFCDRYQPKLWPNMPLKMCFT